MPRTLLILVFALLAGCEAPQVANPPPSQREPQSLLKPPKAILESVARLYDIKSDDWSQHVALLEPSEHPVFAFALNDLISQNVLSERHVRIARDALARNVPPKLDSSQVLKLLETSAYADVMCEFGEYPIRVSTLEYIQSGIESPSIQRELNAVLKGYTCKLSDDESNLLITAMEIRVPEYARQLLRGSDHDKGG